MDSFRRPLNDPAVNIDGFDRAGACWSIPAIVHADAAAQHWRSVLRQQRGVQPSIALPRGKVAESIARHGQASLAPAPLQEFRPAGVPSTRVTDYDNGWDIPSATIGGVARLQDMCTAGDGERLHRLEGASSFEYDGDVGRGVHGGWVPAEPAGVDSAACGDRRVHGVGFREGSAQWRRHAAAAADRDEARGLMRAEHERAARYFGRKDEAAEVVEAAEARAALEERERGAVATDRHRRASVNPMYCAADATIPSAAERAAAERVMATGRGYRTGSAAARRAAGGLLESPGSYRGSHSGRLGAAEEARAAQQREAAALAVARREEGRRREEAEHELRLAQHEIAAEWLNQQPERLGYMERVAARKQINFKLNMALAQW